MSDALRASSLSLRNDLRSGLSENPFDGVSCDRKSECNSPAPDRIVGNPINMGQ